MRLGGQGSGFRVQGSGFSLCHFKGLNDGNEFDTPLAHAKGLDMGQVSMFHGHPALIKHTVTFLFSKGAFKTLENT